jgi:hypothetical protein
MPLISTARVAARSNILSFTNTSIVWHDVATSGSSGVDRVGWVLKFVPYESAERNERPMSRLTK